MIKQVVDLKLCLRNMFSNIAKLFIEYDHTCI